LYDTNLLSWSHHFESFIVAIMTWLTVMEYLCHKWPRICSTCRNTLRSFPHSWLITGFVTTLTRRVPLVEQELLTLPEHMSSPPVFSGVRGTRSLVLYVCFVDRCLSFCTFSFGHCVSVLLRYTDSDYPFGIFKLFCNNLAYGLNLRVGFLSATCFHKCGMFYIESSWVPYANHEYQNTMQNIIFVFWSSRFIYRVMYF